ncbi:MAG: DUF4129 domain-containing protein [Planctomycetota bacterium]
MEDADEVARPKLADFAAVAVAPVLIFVMISSLANFFVVLFYDGQFSDRLWYLISMYTMGSVALARIVIENDRSYSAGYAIALGAAMVLVLTRFVGALPFSIGIVLLIGYLADRIVHDCTLIDYTVDASGEGLIDRAVDEANGIRKHDSDPEVPETEKARRRRKSYQPGRTVFLLALAAFPLFGLGQFMLAGDSNTWGRAQLMLALYLFASLSLLVTTSFLNLRRYLRQRDVDMPTNVTVAWLAGGILMIAALMMTAFLAPLPGQALANLPAPKFLETGETMASAFGWGGEGADKTESDSDSETSRDNASDKEKKGAGENENEGSGQTGGQKPSDKTAGSEQGQPSDSGSPSEADGQSDSKPQGSNSKSENGNQQQTGANSEQPMESQNASSDQSEQQSSSGDANESGEQGESGDDGQSPQGQGEQGESSKGDAESSESDPSEGEDPSDSDRRQDSESGTQSDQQESGSNSQPDPTSEQQSQPQSSGLMESLGSLFSAIGSLIRILLIVALIAVVGYYVYRMRERILAWWHSLFEKGGSQLGFEAEGPAAEIAAPPKPFASFRNPIGREKDPRRIILITCQAFDAWARERGFPRSQDETPSSYIERLRSVRLPGEVSSVVAPVEPSCIRIGNAYDRIVFGRGGASERDLKAAAEVWKHMSASRPTAVQA